MGQGSGSEEDCSIQALQPLWFDALELPVHSEGTYTGRFSSFQRSHSCSRR
jgi:hypothetical protein